MNLNQYLASKYAMDTAENLLAQLHANPQARLPQQQPVNPTNEHTLQRMVTADALDDAGRTGEAQLLRDPDQHVVVRGGRVRAGRFTSRHLRVAERNVHDVLYDWFGGVYEPTYDTDVEENQTPTGDGTAIVRHYPFDTEDGDDGEIHTLPYHEIGPHLADRLEGESPSCMDSHPDPEWDNHADAFEQSLKNLRNAPYDEVDLAHPSERKKAE